MKKRHMLPGVTGNCLLLFGWLSHMVPLGNPSFMAMTDDAIGQLLLNHLKPIFDQVLMTFCSCAEETSTNDC